MEASTVPPQGCWSAGFPMGKLNVGIRDLAKVRAQFVPGGIMAHSTVRVKVLSEVRIQCDFSYPSSLPSAALTVNQQPPRGRSLSLKPRETPTDDLTHCKRCRQVPGCLRTRSSRCASCPGSSSAPGAGTSGPEGVKRGRPPSAGFPGRCPPGRGSCGCAGHPLEGELHSQGRGARLKQSPHAVPAPSV